MDLQKRNFLKKAYEIGGIAALFSLGLSNAQASMIIQTVASGGAAPTCTTSLWQNMVVGAADLDINDAETFTYVGQALTDTSENTVYCVEFKVKWKAGVDTGKVFRAYMIALDANHDFIVGNLDEADDTVAGDDNWSESVIQFKWTSGFTPPNDTEYAILITMDGAADSSNYAELYTNATTAFPSGARCVWNSTGVNQSHATNGDTLCEAYSD